MLNREVRCLSGTGTEQRTHTFKNIQTHGQVGEKKNIFASVNLQIKQLLEEAVEQL